MFRRIHQRLVALYRRWLAALAARRPRTAAELRQALADIGPRPAPLEPVEALSCAFSHRLGDGLRIQARADSTQQRALEWALFVTRLDRSPAPTAVTTVRTRR
jgi:hypothetical protein